MLHCVWFWLFDDIKISTLLIQKSKDIKNNKKRLKQSWSIFRPLVNLFDYAYILRIHFIMYILYIIYTIYNIICIVLYII